MHMTQSKVPQRNSKVTCKISRKIKCIRKLILLKLYG